MYEDKNYQIRIIQSIVGDISECFYSEDKKDISLGHFYLGKLSNLLQHMLADDE